MILERLVLLAAFILGMVAEHSRARIAPWCGLCNARTWWPPFIAVLLGWRDTKSEWGWQCPECRRRADEANKGTDIPF